MPFPKNCPSLQDLPDLPPQEIAALPADVLAVLQHESETALKQAKAAKVPARWRLVLKYGTQAAEARRAAGKDTGTVRFDDGDITVVADLPKRVDWDQASSPAWSSASAPRATIRPSTSRPASRSPSATTVPGPRRSGRVSSPRAPCGPVSSASSCLPIGCAE